MFRWILTAIILITIAGALVGCGSGGTSDADKMFGKWIDENNFTKEIRWDETDGYVLVLGDKRGDKPQTDLIFKNGVYDKKTKKLTFTENDQSRRPHEYWYDAEKDELVYTFQDGSTGRAKRDK